MRGALLGPDASPAPPKYPQLPSETPDKFVPVTDNHVFLPGHRLMQVQSIWFPLYDRNPQTFVPSIFWAEPEDFRKAVPRIYHSPEKASFLELPVATP